MRNWAVDESQLDHSSDEYKIWKLEQLINFGLDEGDLLDKKQLVKYWDKINIDPDKRNFLSFILKHA